MGKQIADHHRNSSFTQAASYLHVTTGAVSQQISLLEKQLAVRLFERHSKGITLTYAGQQIYAAVEKGLGDIERTIEAFRQEKIPEVEIRVKLTPSFAFYTYSRSGRLLFD